MWNHSPLLCHPLPRKPRQSLWTRSISEVAGISSMFFFLPIIFFAAAGAECTFQDQCRMHVPRCADSERIIDWFGFLFLGDLACGEGQCSDPRQRAGGIPGAPAATLQSPSSLCHHMADRVARLCPITSCMTLSSRWACPISPLCLSNLPLLKTSCFFGADPGGPP